jgi:long-chain acyl-CoA synthetase
MPRDRRSAPRPRVAHSLSAGSPSSSSATSTAGVLEAAVVGRPDDVLGKVVIAYVALRPGADVTVDELHALCADRLAKCKRPVLIEVLDELPKNPVGKLDKPALRALATA